MTLPIPTAPTERFDCRWKGYSVLGSTCLELQSVPRAKASERNQFCASGECDQGKKVAAALAKLSAVPAPVPVPVARKACRGVGEPCGRTLGEFNEDGHCGACRTKARRAERAGSVFAASNEVEKQEAQPAAAPPPPAPETTMAETCNDPEGCEGPAKAQGKCGKHYQRWVRAGRPGGDPEPAAAPAKRASPKPRAAPIAPQTRQVITAELAAQLTLEELELCLAAAEAKVTQALAMRDRLRAFGTPVAPPPRPAEGLSLQ